MGKEQFSMVNSMTDLENQDFIKKLELIRDLEAEKPIEEMDVSLIKTCVELILELRGQKPHLSTEEVEEKVRKIPFVEETTTLNTPPESVKGRSTKVKSNKILLIAAIIAILVTIFTISSIAFDWNIFDELKNKFGTVFNAPVNEEMVSGVTVVSNGNSNFYSSVEEALESEKLDVLYPSEISSDLKIERISFYHKDGYDEVLFLFNNDLSYSVMLNSILSQEIKNGADEVLNINEIKCYLSEMNDVGVSQIYFEYNGNVYEIIYNSKQGLVEVVENLKETE